MPPRRPTGSAKEALKRLGTLMGWKVQKGNKLVRRSDGLEWRPKPASRQLAQLAALAQRLEPEAPERIMWTGKPPKGLSGWEQAALEWLRRRAT